MGFAIKSPAFAEGSSIPKKYTLDGENISPPLTWSDPPRNTRSFALMCEDPDAPSGTFRHWAVCNIEPDRNGLPEGVGSGPASTYIAARNDFGHDRYDGPRPPSGHGVHHYHFRIAALDTDHVDVSPDRNADELWRAVQPHILAQAETIGTYQR
jgi:Raf kinase inhibitor-like YbhB/YbcL family protein